MSARSVEEMSHFFDQRVDSYDHHMLHDISDAQQFYKDTAKLIPDKPDLNLLDLGCGTGLGLHEIFKMNAAVHVTGIDLSEKMLGRLRSKFNDRANQLTLMKGSYFDIDFGKGKFNVALSVQTMHHFTHKQKIYLYSKIYKCLLPGGFYIETDYIAHSQREEDHFFAESRRLRPASVDADKTFFHIDIPCTIDNQMKLLKSAGFHDVRLDQCYQHSALFIANKQPEESRNEKINYN